MPFKNKTEKFSYALGYSLAGNLLQSQIKKVDFDSMFSAIRDVMEGNQLKISQNEANQIIEEYFSEQQAVQGELNEKVGNEFLENNRKENGVIELKSGLQYKILVQGDGLKPKATDKVKCHYHGTLINGEVFDSSVKRDQPAVFPVSGVIKGWVEALQMMNTGSKWRLFIPPHLAYGDHGTGAVIGPKSTLIFDVELIEII